MSEIRNDQARVRYSTKALCISAMLIALFVVLDYYANLLSVPLGPLFGIQMKLSFAGLPIILAAMLYGPWRGMTVGLLGAFLSQMLSYGLSVSTVLWVIPHAARGLVMGFLFLAFKKSSKFYWVFLQILISSLVVTLLNTGALYIDGNMLGYYNPATFMVGALVRVISGALTSVAYLVALPIYLGVRRVALPRKRAAVQVVSSEAEAVDANKED